MGRVHILAALIVAAFGGPAFAQPAQAPSASAKELVGGWEISDAERERRCPVTFSVDPAPGGYKLEFQPECATAFPQLSGVVAWTIGQDEVLRLLDAGKKSVLEFTQVENGLYQGERKDEGLYFMQALAAIKAEIRTADQLFGDWTILREVDKPLCTLTLSNAPSASDTYKIAVKPGCNAAIAGFGFLTWRLDRDHLVLTGRSGQWLFTESDVMIWERVPFTTDPLLLMKQ